MSAAIAVGILFIGLEVISLARHAAGRNGREPVPDRGTAWSAGSDQNASIPRHTPQTETQRFKRR